MDRRQFLGTLAAGMGSLALSGTADQRALAEEADMLSLTATPAQIGTTWGRVNAEAIRAHCDEFVQGAAERGIDGDELLRRAERTVQIIDRVAPHWREEADAVAAEAGIDPGLHLAYHIGKYRGLLLLEPECTSYAAGGSATARGLVRPPGGAVFHKSRDNVARPQVAYVKRQSVAGVHAFLTLADTSDLGCMMMVNERGLAGSADTGPTDEHPSGEGLMNPWGLRYIAERAASCDEALAILQEWTDQGWYAGGRIGTNWLFADAAGNLLRAVNYNDRLEAQHERDGFLLNVEREGLRELMTEKAGELDDAAFMDAARLPGVSFDSTISALTVAIDRDRPSSSIPWVCVGRPGRLPFVPLALGVEHMPVALLDGSLSRPPTEPGLPAEQVAEMEADFRARAKAIDTTDSTALEELTADCVRDTLAALTASR